MAYDVSWKSKLSTINDENVLLKTQVVFIVKEIENIKLEYQKLFNSIKATQTQHQKELDELIEHVNQKTYAYADVRAQNQDLLITISELKNKLRIIDKGKNVNIKFDKSETLGKLLCVTPLPKNIEIKAKKVSNSKVNTDSSNSVRRPKSKDTKSKNSVLKNTKAKSSTAHVQKMSCSASIDCNKREANNLNVIQLVLWIVDSGCMKHMTGSLQLLRNFVDKFMGTVHLIISLQSLDIEIMFKAISRYVMYTTLKALLEKKASRPSSLLDAPLHPHPSFLAIIGSSIFTVGLLKNRGDVFDAEVELGTWKTVNTTPLSTWYPLHPPDLSSPLSSTPPASPSKISSHSSSGTSHTSSGPLPRRRHQPSSYATPLPSVSVGPSHKRCRGSPVASLEEDTIEASIKATAEAAVEPVTPPKHPKQTVVERLDEHEEIEEELHTLRDRVAASEGEDTALRERVRAMEVGDLSLRESLRIARAGQTEMQCQVRHTAEQLQQCQITRCHERERIRRMEAFLCSYFDYHM
ncbi:hypothetical protein Tco_0195828 [Tanacetum coccineum]